MSIESRIQRTVRRAVERQLQKTEPKRTSRLRSSKVIASLLGIFATLAGLLTLFPRLSVANGSAIDLTDPFSAPFRVVNEGLLPLFSTRFFMRDIKMRGQDGSVGRIAGEAYAQDWRTPIFWPTDGIDLYAGRVIDSRLLTSVELAIVVEYRPFGVPLPR